MKVKLYEYKMKAN